LPPRGTVISPQVAGSLGLPQTGIVSCGPAPSSGKPRSVLPPAKSLESQWNLAAVERLFQANANAIGPDNSRLVQVLVVGRLSEKLAEAEV